MSDCNTCKFYWVERDVNAAGCYMKQEDKYWDGEEECPDYSDCSGGYDDD